VSALDVGPTAGDATAGSVTAVPAVPSGRLLTIVRKEFWSLLVSPVSWILFVLLYFFRGFETLGVLTGFGRQGDVDTFVSYYLLQPSTQWMVAMVPPILTMRAFAEEKRSGSLELLMTAPVRDHEVVAGKWLASWLFYGLLWLPTLGVLLGLQWYLGLDLAYAQVGTSCLGLLAIGSLLLAVGILTSSLTDNQLLASLSGILFGIGLLAVPPRLAADQSISVDSPLLALLIDQMHVLRHLQFWFFRGLVDTGHLVFYLTTTLLVLFLTVRVVESRKWR
jgi:ABC-2 type transport system permease protein